MNKKRYDTIAERYAIFERHNPRKHILIAALFKKAVGSLKGKDVLDLGSGLGFFATLAKKLGAGYVLGVDISRRMTERAKQEAKESALDIEYKTGDVGEFRSDKKFDVITAGFVFSYAQTRQELGKYISAASRHLKTGGQLFAIVCNPNNPLRDKKVLYRVTSVAPKKLGDGTQLRCEFYDGDGKFLCYDHKFLWSRKTIESVLRESGFDKTAWSDITNASTRSKIPQLPSTNIVLCAARGKG